MKIRTYRITLQFLIFVVLNMGLIIGFYGIPSPFFYCHACPSASVLCPVGAEQYAVIVDPLLLLYFFGFLAFIGVIFGRGTCGWGCPIGTLQDIFSLKSRKRVLRDKPYRYAKFIILLLTLLLSCLLATKVFTDICPIGFLTATIPTLLLIPGYVEPMFPFFQIKIVLTIVFFILIYFIARGWCRYICPLGAQLSIFNSISVLKIEKKAVRCTNCGACKRVCPMGINPVLETESMECIRCGRCIDACKNRALSFALRWKHVH
jgi:ferredoxin-type protein NapH